VPSKAALVSASIVVSLALATGATPTVAARECTYTFPAAGGTYREAVADGDIICGGPGPDRVLRMAGGTFIGGGGHDGVRRMHGGTFKAGEGADQVVRLYDGTFIGRLGRDRVAWMSGGTFKGGRGPDGVVVMAGGTFDGGLYDDLVVEFFAGTFDGGDGTDEIPVCLDDPTALHLNVEAAARHACAGILSGRGAPVREP
jgi:hypothetical protein